MGRGQLKAAPLAAVLGGIASLSVGTSLAKSLFAVLGAEGAVALRVGFAALILLAIWRPWRLPLTRRRAGSILLYGLVLGAMNLMFYLALRTLPLGLAVAIELTGPLTVAALSSRRRLDLVWVGCAAAGLLLLLPLAPGAAGLDPVGVAFAFGAAVCWGLYIVLGQKAGSGHAGQATALGMATAAVVVAPFGLSHVAPVLTDPALLAAGLAVALLSSVIPYSLEMFALARLPRQTFGVLMSLEPATSAFAGFLVLGERLAPLQWVAVAAIIVASVGVALSARERAPDLSPEP